MLFSAAALPATLLLISKPWLATANGRDQQHPTLTSKSTCNPTLTGLEVSIISTSSGSAQWGVSQDVAGTALSHALGQVPLNSSAEWRVMQIGSSQPTYVFGDINKDSLVVDAPSVAGGAAPALKLSLMDSSETQKWQIDCQQCFPDVASNPSPGGGRLATGCAIKRISSDLCAEMMSGVSAPIGATACSGSSLQTFDFWLPTFNTGMGRPDSASSTPSQSSSSSKPSSNSSSSGGGTCAPDIGGLGVSIIAGSKEWGVSSAVSGTALRSDLGKLPLDNTAEWRVKQLGSAQGPNPPTYIFEEIGHTNLVVNALSVAGGGMPVLTLSPFDTSSETQIWEVECHECESNKVLIEGGGMMGKGCTIKVVGSGLCAQIESGTTASIGVASCSKAVAQTFDFYHAIPAASVPGSPQPSSPGSGSSSCASSSSHVASGNLLSGALASDNSAGFNYAPVIIGILATNLLILLVLLCLGVMSFIRNGKKAGLTRNYVPVKINDTDAFLAPPFEDDKRYSDS
ncbi:hypothetical protein K438DRAFT_1976992 [Mycena galopus ATCC 62051]|nr:hypothetical protein K438DRAFT_1976992 [Mycena galopus ATCC 62051]